MLRDFLSWPEFDCCLFVSKHLEVPEISLHWKSGSLCKIENRFVKTMIIITSGLGIRNIPQAGKDLGSSWSACSAD